MIFVKRNKKKIFMPILIGTMLTLIISCNNNETTPEADPYTKVELYMGTDVAGLGNLGNDPLETPLYLPHDITMGPNGSLYVLDWNNHRILAVENNVVKLVIGNGGLGDAADGIATSISLNHPTNVSFDPQGYLILSAWHNSKVMKLDLSTGFIEAIFGDGRRRHAGDGGLAIDAAINLPSSTVFDSNGRMYVSAQGDNRIRVVDTNNIVNTYAGTGRIGSKGDGGLAIEAEMFTGGGGQSTFPGSKMDIDSENTIYISESGNDRIRMIDASGIINTAAGSPTARGFSGENIQAVDAVLNQPADVAIDSNDNIYIADTFNHCIRKIDNEGVITTFVGICTEPGSEGIDGIPTEIKLNRPYGIAFDSEDNLYIADTHNHRVLVVKK